MKNILLLAMLTLFLLQSCGESKPTDSSTENTESATATPAATETNVSTESTTTEATSSDNLSVITDAVMEKVCTCVKESGEEESDIAKIKECMGGSSAEYVARLLGEGASEKQKTDAQNELQERMQAQCPLLRK